MGGSWFGSLDLAFKYAIVFGGLLVLTLVAGLIKVLYDRKKLKKLMAKEDPGARSDEEELHMREKDEGDLFGIRAIEAGFFGGVAQSRPTSVVNSPAASRAVSPAPSNRNSMVISNAPNTNSRSFSPSTSTLNVSQYGQRSSSADTVGPAPPRAGTPSGLRQVSSFSQDVDGRSATRKNPPPSIRVPSQARLQPSDAELNGRINHSAAVNMALEVPPSPLRLSPPSHAQQHPHPHSPTSDSSQPQEHEQAGPSQPQYYQPQQREIPQIEHQHYEPQQRQIPQIETQHYEPQQQQPEHYEPQQHNRQYSDARDQNSEEYNNQYLHPDSDLANDPSRLSTASSRYSWRNSVMKDYSTSPPQLSLPSDLTTQFEVDENLHGADKSNRASIISGTNNSSRTRDSPPPEHPSVPSLPAYPAKAVVDSTQRYDSFTNDRAPKSPMASPVAEAHDPLMGGSSGQRRPSNAFPANNDVPNPSSSYRTAPSNFEYDNSYGSEPRTSLSYAQTDAEYTGGAHRPPRPARQLGEGVPMSKLQSQPIHPNTSAGYYVPSPGGKGGEFF